MTAIIVGAMVIITAGILYPFWPDTAPLGNLWSSIVMAGMGGYSILIGAWWKLREHVRYDARTMKIGTIAGGITTLLFGAAMYPLWPDSAVLGPFWSSIVMGGVGLSITIVGSCLAIGRG